MQNEELLRIAYRWIGNLPRDASNDMSKLIGAVMESNRILETVANAPHNDCKHLAKQAREYLKKK